MKILLDDFIYEPVSVYDYQAVCYEPRNITYKKRMEIISSANSIFLNPIKYFWMTLVSFLSALGNFVSVVATKYIPNCKLSNLFFIKLFFAFIAKLQ